MFKSGFTLLTLCTSLHILSPPLSGAPAHESASIPTYRIHVSPDHSSLTDRHAIQAALDSLKSRGGGTLELAAGRFRIENSQFAISCDSCRNIEIVGAGAGTILGTDAAGEGADAYFRFRHASSVSFRNMRMEGLLLPKEAWETNLEYHGGIIFAESRDVRIDSCAFHGFFTGGIVFQSGSRRFAVEDCVFDSVSYRLKGDYGAISIESGSGNASIQRNRFRALTHSAVSAYASDSLLIQGNRADFDPRSVYTMGVYAPQGLSASIISRNRFSGMFNEGVVLNSGTRGVIGNRIERNVLNARFAGVALNDGLPGCNQGAAADNVIFGNKISGIGADSVHHAVLLNRATRTTVEGNDMSRSRRAISIQNCTTETRSLRNSTQ